MSFKTLTLAAALIGGLATLPSAASADPGRGHRPGYGMNNGHPGRGYNRGHRRVCHWERYRGHRVQRCSYR